MTTRDPSRRNALSLRRILQSFLLLLPSLALIRLHKKLEQAGIVPDDFDVFPQVLPFSDSLPSSRYGAIGAFPQRHLSYESYENITNHTRGHGGYASVSLSAGRKAMTRGVSKAKRKTRRKQRKVKAQEGKRPRRRPSKDDTEWVPYPENITTFSYTPVGKYADKYILRKKLKKINNPSNATSPYAYAFVMGGVNEQDGRYLGMFYNILIANYILEKEGSTADVVVYVQMSPNSTLTKLPENNTRLLHQVGVKQIKYLPKPKVENFHQIIMQKLVVLDLVEYRRVVFLDTDVMPFCNLDYVFELSDGPNPILKNNLIIALSGSPANAGFFMLSPKPGELEKLQRIVAKQQESAKELPYPHFDEIRGWGHVIRPPDEWWTINKLHTRRQWKFVGSHADQGLLYHWVKYVKRSVSIVSGEEVDNYGPVNGQERIRIEKTLVNPFDKYTCFPEKYEDTFGELPTSDARFLAPYRDFVHFLGSKKPWKRNPPPPVASNVESETPLQYWFFMLRLLNKELGLGIDFENWKKIKKTPLGSLPKKDLMVELLQANQTLLQS